MINPVTELRGLVRASVAAPADGDAADSAEALVQRRWISSVTLAVGSFMMAWTLRLAPGDPAYYAATLTLAATWIVGGLLAGKLHLGQSGRRPVLSRGRDVLDAVLLGLLVFAVFLAGAALMATVPALRASLVALLAHDHYGWLPIVGVLTLLTAVGEELFFRGALYAAVGGRQALLVTTLVYALSTIPTGIPLLIIGAALLGAVTGLQRQLTGGVLGPVITHAIWSIGLFLALPAVVGF